MQSGPELEAGGSWRLRKRDTWRWANPWSFLAANRNLPPPVSQVRWQEHQAVQHLRQLMALLQQFLTYLRSLDFPPTELLNTWAAPTAVRDVATQAGKDDYVWKHFYATDAEMLLPKARPGVRPPSLEASGPYGAAASASSSPM